MGRGIAIAFAYAGHRIALIDSAPRASPRPRRALRDEAFAEIRPASTAWPGSARWTRAQIDAIAARVQLVDAADAPAALAAAD